MSFFGGLLIRKKTTSPNFCQKCNYDSISFFCSSSECDITYEMDHAYEDLVSKEPSSHEGPRTLTILNREVVFQRTCGRILDSTFNELCRRVRIILFLEILNYVKIYL